VPKDTYYRERARKLTKREIQPGPPSSITCPKCGSHPLDVNIDHNRKYVTVTCICFGKFKLKYKGPASEPVDYLAELIDKPRDFDVSDRSVGFFNEEKASSKAILIQKPKSRAVLVRKLKGVDIRPYVLSAELAEAVRQFMLRNPSATDLQCSAVTRVPYTEVRKIRGSILEKTDTASHITTQNQGPPATSKENVAVLVQCPHCSSKVRKDRLSKHIQKTHRMRD